MLATCLHTHHARTLQIQKVEVLRLARRKRAKLFYLRERSGKESTVNFDMRAVPAPGDHVPVDRPVRAKAKTSKGKAGKR